MTVRTASTGHTNYHDDALHTLEQLASQERGIDNVVFEFDVLLHRWNVLCPAGLGEDTTRDLSLAIYNELKLSQYIVEHDTFTDRELRRFSLTARGRLVASAAER